MATLTTARRHDHAVSDALLALTLEWYGDEWFPVRAVYEAMPPGGSLADLTTELDALARLGRVDRREVEISIDPAYPDEPKTPHRVLAYRLSRDVLVERLRFAARTSAARGHALLTMLKATQPDGGAR